jgi:hypothetical protein
LLHCPACESAWNLNGNQIDSIFDRAREAKSESVLRTLWRK